MNHFLKTFIALSVLFISALQLKAQSEDEEERSDVLQFNTVEKAPIIEGCQDLETYTAQSDCFQSGVVNYVANNFKYPSKAYAKGVEAKIYIDFIVEKDASISNVKVLRGAEDKYRENKSLIKYARQLDEAAIAVVKELPMAAPAMQRDDAVRMRFTLPINANIPKSE